MVSNFSYIDISYANQFMSRDYQAYNLWNPLTVDEKQLMLNESTRILDNLYEYKGYRSTTTQVLEFPRYLNLDNVENGIIPNIIKEATFEILLFILKTQNFEYLKTADEMGMTKYEEYNEVTLDEIKLKNVPDSTALKLMGYTKLGQAIRG